MGKGEHIWNHAHHVVAHREVDYEIAEGAAEDGGDGGSVAAQRIVTVVAAPAFGGGAPEHRDSEEHALLQNQHEYPRHDERGESLRGIAEEIGFGGDFACHSGDGLAQKTGGIDPFSRNPAPEFELYVCKRREEGSVTQKQRHFVVPCHDSLLTVADFAGVIVGNLEYAVAFFLVHGRAGVGEVVGIAYDVNLRSVVDGAGECAAFGGAAVIHHDYGDAVYNLGVVNQRVYDRVEERQTEEKQQNADVAEHDMEFPAPYVVEFIEPFADI